MNVLYIDTSSNKEIVVRLHCNGKKHTVKQAIDQRRAQVVLSLADVLLKKHGLTVQDLDAIEVNTGPGSFTGLRVGVAVANALSYTLSIPINGQKKGRMQKMRYIGNTFELE